MKSSDRKWQLLLTCEHGGNRIPPVWDYLFHDAEQVLESHEGYDPGALHIAQSLAEAFQAPLHYAVHSRLLIELNRSLSHPKLFSVFSKKMSADEKQRIINKHYLPYRQKVQEDIIYLMRKGPVFHLSIHTFTPVLKGKERNADLGLLYDSDRTIEKSMTDQWYQLLKKHTDNWRIRKNYPYRGKADGFTTALRQMFPDDYIGLEIEINQQMAMEKPSEVITLLERTLQQLI